MQHSNPHAKSDAASADTAATGGTSAGPRGILMTLLAVLITCCTCMAQVSPPGDLSDVHLASTRPPAGQPMHHPNGGLQRLDGFEHHSGCGPGHQHATDAAGEPAAVHRGGSWGHAQLWSDVAASGGPTGSYTHGHTDRGGEDSSSDPLVDVEPFAVEDAGEREHSQNISTCMLQRILKLKEYEVMPAAGLAILRKHKCLWVSSLNAVVAICRFYQVLCPEQSKCTEKVAQCSHNL